jgi:TetR/AcrR family transcriptional repressor of nem operon
MVGPNKQFNQDEALNKALETFWAKGFEVTSMQDLVQNMGINRASMYQTYGNKHALFVAALDRYIETNLEFLKQSLDTPGSPLENLNKIFQLFIDSGQQGKAYGCFINNTAVEMGPHDPLVSEKIRQFWVQFESILCDTLKRAMDQGEIAQQTDIKNLATLLNITLQGLVVKIKTNSPPDELRGCTKFLFSLIKNKACA